MWHRPLRQGPYEFCSQSALPLTHRRFWKSFCMVKEPHAVWLGAPGLLFIITTTLPSVIQGGVQSSRKLTTSPRSPEHGWVELALSPHSVLSPAPWSLARCHRDLFVEVTREHQRAPWAAGVCVFANSVARGPGQKAQEKPPRVLQGLRPGVHPPPVLLLSICGFSRRCRARLVLHNGPGPQLSGQEGSHHVGAQRQSRFPQVLRLPLQIGPRKDPISHSQILGVKTSASFSGDMIQPMHLGLGIGNAPVSYALGTVHFWGTQRWQPEGGSLDTELSGIR